MARSDDLEISHRQGLISDRQYRRAGGRVCGPDEIDDDEYQSSAGNYGPDDAGHIDARANRRMFPKESRMSGRMPGNTGSTSPRAARMQPSYDMYDVPGRN